MKAAVLGGLIGAGLCLVCLGTGLINGPVHAQRIPDMDSRFTSDLIALSQNLAENRQQVTLIDPQQRVMGVYHIDATTGDVALKCVRNFHWDLQMSEFNGASPLPREIRSQVEQR